MVSKSTTKRIASLLVERVVGLTEDEARTLTEPHEVYIRVRQRDGRGLMGTADVRMDRINVAITDGVITAATIG